MRTWWRTLGADVKLGVVCWSALFLAFLLCAGWFGR
jgi:hypothetical protein